MASSMRKHLRTDIGKALKGLAGTAKKLDKVSELVILTLQLDKEESL